MITEEWQLCLESFVRVLDMDWQDVFFTYVLIISLHDWGLKVLRIDTNTHTHTHRKREMLYIYVNFSPSLSYYVYHRISLAFVLSFIPVGISQQVTLLFSKTTSAFRR